MAIRLSRANPSLDIDAIPQEAIDDCSRAGDMSEPVNYWRERLDFSVTREAATRYAKATGAWSAGELRAKSLDDLSNIILWQACCEFHEAQACMERGEAEGELSAGSTQFYLNDY
jgi:hypothetical protein